MGVSFDEERWEVGASLWAAIGGRTIAGFFRDLREDLLGSPVALAEAGTDEIGRLGEDLAELFLQHHEKMPVLWRNFRAPRGGEVDVVCRHGDTLVFVEVKTRTSEYFGRPVTAVDLEKQHLIARGALEWLKILGKPNICFRFDVLEIILTNGAPPRIQRVENAFELPEPYYRPG